MKILRTVSWVLLAAVVAAAAWYFWSAGMPATRTADSSHPDMSDIPTTAPAYVGARACAACHPQQFNAWKGSHHELAMQHASETSVLGDFTGAQSRHGEVTSTFYRRDGRVFVNTEGPDGGLRDYEIKYTFGVYPLQQYLIEFPGGRLQALGVAWDTRPASEGGQKWFHLYPNEKIDHTDELHWTKLSQNWNHMCAECHLTNLKKNFSLADKRFDTTWSEINVSCEACHGPASRHVERAKAAPEAEAIDGKGLVVTFDERKGVSWAIADGASTATRSVPREGTKEIEICARCHSRRATLTQDYHHGKSLMDAHLPALLTEPLYYPDGQIREEDFEYGSFVQSRMFHQGVTCSDCHDPHSQKLRTPGNGTCLQCHKAETYDSSAHHFHPVNGKGGTCVACHMPATNFMVVHARHDHSIRIPRPDLSMKLGTPNACTQCHADRQPAWAEAQLRKWYGEDWSAGWHFGETLHEASRQLPTAGTDLAAVSLSPQVPDIARATAASMLAGYLEPTTLVVLPKLLADPSAMVRREALGIVDNLPPERRWQLAGKLLNDPVLAVRIEAARVLSVVSQSAPAPSARSALDSAVQEYIAVAMSSAEHPQSHVNLGLLYLGLGEFAKAESACRQAIALDASYVPAYVNLADIYRASQQDQKAEDALLKARAANGANAAVEHALGLHYVRTQQMTKAMEALALASRLEPDNARYGYVYAVALNGNGETAQAIRTLETLHASHPNDRDVLIALVSFHQAAANHEAAARHAATLVALDSRYGSVEQVLQQLSTP